MPWDEFSKNREASFHSMKNILLHMTDNEDWMVNWVVRNKSTEYRREKKSEDYVDIQMVLYHLGSVEKKTREYLKGLKEDGKKKPTRYSITKSRLGNCLFPSIFLAS